MYSTDHDTVLQLNTSDQNPIQVNVWALRWYRIRTCSHLSFKNMYIPRLFIIYALLEGGIITETVEGISSVHRKKPNH